MSGVMGVMTALVVTALRFGEGFTVQASLGLGALYRPALPGFSPWSVTVAPRAQLSLGWCL